MSYVELIGVAILSSKENTIILSRSRNFASIVSKLGKKVLISIKNELCEFNRSIMTFLHFFSFSEVHFYQTWSTDRCEKDI